jgi:Asp-tRNA(Asn)/Glu-tRNA(Gln) amidotransferase A subunit family amidase
MLEPGARATLLNSAEQIAAAGAVVEAVTLPALFDDYFQQASILSAVGMAVNHGQDYDQYAEQMSPPLRELIEQGRSISALTYGKVHQTITHYSLVLADIFAQYDAILTPVTTGAASRGLNNTGSPIFCALWTLCGLPAINIPIHSIDDRLPLGIQLVGRRTGDCELLAIAAWVAEVMHIKPKLAADNMAKG